MDIYRNLNIYFVSIYLAYLAGLLLTIFVMHVYKHAQPALLYLVPACLGKIHTSKFGKKLINRNYLLSGVPLFLALVRGDIKSMFQYEDHPDLDAEKKKDK